VGAGKVVFHSTDEVWRWSRHPEGEQFYARYWIQMTRYLSRSRLLGGNRAVQLVTDRNEYQRGETVRLRARFFDERVAPSQDDGVTVVLTTHDMDEADALCDRVAIIDGGRIVALDTAAGLKASVQQRLGLDHPATLNEAFMAHTGRDWENDEPEEEDDDE